MSNLVEKAVGRILADDGPLLSHVHLDEASKHFEVEKQRRIQQKKRHRVQVAKVSGGAVSDSEGSDSEGSQILKNEEDAYVELSNRRMIKREMRRQSYQRILPHHEATADFEKRLRRIATSGVVQLFNSVFSAEMEQKKENDELAAMERPRSDDDDDGNWTPSTDEEDREKRKEAMMKKKKNVAEGGNKGKPGPPRKGHVKAFGDRGKVDNRNMFVDMLVHGQNSKHMREREKETE
eukprot:PhF_6_TR34753/c0_g1_i2/m.50578